MKNNELGQNNEESKDSWASDSDDDSDSESDSDDDSDSDMEVENNGK
jgi:hypothetical protein